MTQKLRQKIKPYVSYDQKIRSGQACFIGTRIPVSYVIKHLSLGWCVADIKKLFPEINLSDLNKIINIFSEELENNDEEKIKTTWLAYT